MTVAWTPLQDALYDIRDDFTEAMNTAREGWMELSKEQRADPNIANRYTQLKQSIVDRYLERREQAIQHHRPTD